MTIIFFMNFIFSNYSWAETAQNTIPVSGASLDASVTEGAIEAMTVEQLMQIRDPFQMPVVITKQATKKVAELETIPIEQLNLVGVISGPDKVRAMLVGPGDKTFIISQGIKVGIKGGVVKKITKKEVRVLERAENPLGQLEDVWQSISLGDKK
ncbi:MAG: pilus assembly protein PilP [Xanthomonadaceae bacterium]|nr:pilus assembly protein PilP [Xanthomonadaceae bacterium]